MTIEGEQLKQFASAGPTQDADLFYTSQGGGEAAMPASQLAAYTNAKVNPANLPVRNTLTGAEQLAILQSDALVSATLTDLITTNATRETFLSGAGFTPGVTTSITLAGTYGSIYNIGVYFDDNVQFDCTLVGNVLTFNPVVPSGVQAINITGGSARTIGTPSAGTVGDAQLAVGSNVMFVSRSIYPAARWGVQYDGVTDDTAAWQAALNTGYKIEGDHGSTIIKASLTMVSGGGFIGAGETTKFIRKFSGGQLIRFPGGGLPIYLRDFLITTDPSITPVSGDTGIDIGYASSWTGRGEIANLLIAAQYDGFKWTAGTAGPINNVQALGNLGNGFYGINPRMEFYDCLSQSNAGNGYLLNTTVSGETGVSFTRSGTFANQGYGFLAQAGAGLSGANVNLIASGSSFDGQGGIFFASPYLQIWMSQVLSEYSGYAHNFNPTFSSNAAAVGIQLGACTNVTGSDIQALNCAGAGMLLDSCNTVSLGQVLANGNGTGLQGGSNQAGVLFNNNNVGVSISGLVSNAGANQTTDIALGSGNDINLISPVFRSYVNSGNSLIRFVGRETTASNVITSSATTRLIDYYDFQIVSGTANINNIIGASMQPGRTVTLLFTGALTVSNTGNIKLLSSFTASANSTLTLVTDGTYWYGK